jgi:hypothetical protein
MAKKEYEIWIEGYAATGESSTASYIGKAMGDTFEDACNNFEYPEDEFNMGIKVHSKGEKLPLDEKGHGGKPSIWACRLFDNEADARKSFG